MTNAVKSSRSVRESATADPRLPRALVTALARAGLLGAVISMPAGAVTLSIPPQEAVQPTVEPMLYIAQNHPGYGSLNSYTSKGPKPAPSNAKGGASSAPARPQGGSSPAPGPAPAPQPAPDSRNSSR